MDRLIDGWPWKDDYKERRIIKYNIISLTVPESSLFQIRGGEFSSCSEWTVSKS